MMNPICNGCPGALMGDCEDCGVTREEAAREDYEIDSYDDDFHPNADEIYEETQGGDGDVRR